MHLQEPFTAAFEASPLEYWNDESTANVLRAQALQLHSTGLSLRDTAAALEQAGATRSHQAVGRWVHRLGDEPPDPPTFPRAKPS